MTALVPFYCRYCRREIVQTLPRSTVWCPKGHKCSKNKPKEMK